GPVRPLPPRRGRARRRRPRPGHVPRRARADGRVRRALESPHVVVRDRQEQDPRRPPDAATAVVAGRAARGRPGDRGDPRADRARAPAGARARARGDARPRRSDALVAASRLRAGPRAEVRRGPVRRRDRARREKRRQGDRVRPDARAGRVRPRVRAPRGEARRAAMSLEPDVLERNLQLLFTRAYAPVRAAPAFRARLQRELESAIAGTRRAARPARSAFAVRLAAAILVAVGAAVLGW